MFIVSDLLIYPIKSLGGISLSSSPVTDRGLQYDRRWMLVDEDCRFLSQREIPEMALFRVSLEEKGLRVIHTLNRVDSQFIPFQCQDSHPLTRVKVWSDVCLAQVVDQKIDEWFSEALSFKCKLVYMPDQTHRAVDTRYAGNAEITSFSDAYPMLLIGERSLNDLNERMSTPLPMNRFRPNIVFSGGRPFEEDTMAHFTIGSVHFYGVKLSARCVITTINQDEAIKGMEPLKTLSTFRKRNNKIYFGQNLIHKGEGTIKVGDEIKVHQVKESVFSNGY